MHYIIKYAKITVISFFCEKNETVTKKLKSNWIYHNMQIKRLIELMFSAAVAFNWSSN